MWSATEILSVSTVKKLVVEQGRFHKKGSNELEVASFNEAASYKFLYQITSCKLQGKS